PPTLDRVDAFLACVDRDAGEVLGVTLPEQREATVWNVAVNGGMAGGRPEHMPILVAGGGARCDPHWRGARVGARRGGGAGVGVGGGGGGGGGVERRGGGGPGVCIGVGEDAGRESSQHHRGSFRPVVYAERARGADPAGRYR